MHVKIQIIKKKIQFYVSVKPKQKSLSQYYISKLLDNTDKTINSTTFFSLKLKSYEKFKIKQACFHTHIHTHCHVYHRLYTILSFKKKNKPR